MATSSSTDPNPTDEHTVLLKLYGRNEAPVVEMHGWTHYFPVNFPGIEPTRIIKTYHPDILLPQTMVEDTVTRKVKRKYENRQQLVDLLNQRHGSRLYKAVAVTVIGKKQVELVVRADGTVLIFGQIIVADGSGVCIVKFVNTAIHKAYNHIHVGDLLVIGNGTLQDPISNELEIIFGSHESFQRSFVIKIGDFDTYNIHKVKDGVKIYPTPEYMLSGKKLWTPTAIAAETLGYRVVDEFIAVDIIGVISHVSRLERTRRYDSRVTLGNGEQEEHFVQFDVTCWIELVDADSKDPIPIKLWMSSLLWDKQSELVPGSLIVITHLKRGRDTIYAPYLQSSSFSHVYINTRLLEYLLIMGRNTEITDIARKFVGIEASMKILSRNDVTWSVGGAYVQPIQDHSKFLELYHNKRDHTYVDDLGPAWPTMPRMPLFRRESQIMVFKAFLLRYNLFRTDSDIDFQAWSWINNSALEHPGVKNRNIRTIYDPIPSHTRDTPVWSLFTRRLPEHTFDPVPVPSSTIDYRGRMSVYGQVVERRKKYVKPLCMPADVGKCLKKLKAIDGAPHYAVDVWNLEGIPQLERFILTWKPSRHATIEQIKAKLKALHKYETVFVLAEVHRTESLDLEDKHGHQFLIHDITPCAWQPLLSDPVLQDSMDEAMLLLDDP